MFWAKAGAAINAKTAVAALSICFFMEFSSGTVCRVNEQGIKKGRHW
jgi:hypothetical protein